jgi:hypothetical protein
MKASHIVLKNFVNCFVSIALLSFVDAVKVQGLNMALFRSRLIQVWLLTNAYLIAYLCLEQFSVHESCSQIYTQSPSHNYWNEINSDIQIPRNTAPYDLERNELSLQVSRLSDDKTVNSSKLQVKQEVTEHLHEPGISNGAPDPPPFSLEKKMFPDFRGCASRPSLPIQSQHGEYWILENYIPADLSFRCDESITCTTHGDYTHLDNLETIISRWQVWANALPSSYFKAVGYYYCTA